VTPGPAACDPTTDDVELKFVSRALEEPGFDTATFVTSWRVTNPYRVPVTVSRWNYEMSSTGYPVEGPGPDPTVTVPARSCQTIQLKQHLDFKAIFGTEAPKLARYTVSVHPLITGGPSGDREPELKESGPLEIPRPPELLVSRLHVTKGSEKFTIDLELRFDNPNLFDVTIERLEGELLIAGARFGRLSAPQLKLEYRKPQTLPFKLTASIDMLGGLARAALSSSEAISTDVKLWLTIAGRRFPQNTGGMIYPR
jgi:hypothetical protein